jgi:hypothetical protein
MNVIPGIDLEEVHQLLAISFELNTKQKLYWRNREAELKSGSKWIMISMKIYYLLVTKIYV